MSQYLNRAAGEVWERLQPLFGFPEACRPRGVYDAGDIDGMDFVRRTFDEPPDYGRIRNGALLLSSMEEGTRMPAYDVLLVNARDEERNALLGRMLTEGAHTVHHIGKRVEQWDWPGCQESYFGSYHTYFRAMLGALGSFHAPLGRQIRVELPASSPEGFARFVGCGLAVYLVRNAPQPLPLMEIFNAPDDKAGADIVREATGNLMIYMAPEDMARHADDLERFVLDTGLDFRPTRDPSSRIVRGGVGRGN